MEIQYAGKISKNDLLKCILISNPQLKRQKWLFGFILFFLVFAFVDLSIEGQGEYSILLKYMTSGSPFILLFLTFPWWLPYLQLSSYNQKGNIYRDNVHGTINESGISINNADVKVTFQWSAYTHYKFDKDLFLIYQGKISFTAFKQEMFQNYNEWETFISFAKDKIKVSKGRA